MEATLYSDADIGVSWEPYRWAAKGEILPFS